MLSREGLRLSLEPTLHRVIKNGLGSAVKSLRFQNTAGKKLFIQMAALYEVSFIC